MPSKILSIIVVSILLAGCATPSAPVSQQFANLAKKTIQETPPNAAVLNVISSSSWNSPLCVDEQKVGVLAPMSRAHLVLSPGQHTINVSVPDEPNCANRAVLQPNFYNAFIYSVKVDLSAGKNHFLTINQNLKKAQIQTFEPTQQNLTHLDTYPLLVSYIAPNADLAAQKSGIETSTQVDRASNTNNSNNIENAKDECADLGFSPNTEDFGKCVLELLD